jgi:DNA invertase Pin-like site-specific DNA recombinase
MTTNTGTAAIYTRLSEANDESTSTLRQERDARAHAAALGLEVVRVFTDDGISGYKDVHRPAFEEATAALAAGEFSTLLVWKLDRLSRRGMGAVGNLLDRLEGTGGRIVSVLDGVDTSQTQGRMLVALLSEMARGESSNISTRVRSAFEEHRRRGEWVHGRAPWGFVLEAKRLHPDPATEDAARWVIERATAGQSLHSLAHDMNARGLRTPAAGDVRRGRVVEGEWTAASLSGWLRSPVLCGLLPEGRRSRGAARHPETGEPVSIGEGLISETEWSALQKVTAARGRSRFVTSEAPVGPSPWGGDLTGARSLLVCGRCGGSMHTGTQSYRCAAANRGKASCQGLSVKRDTLDAYLLDAVVARLAVLGADSPALDAAARAWRGEPIEAATEHRAALAERLSEVEARLSRLEDDYYVRERLTEARYDALRSKLDAEADALRAEMGDPIEHDASAVLGAFAEPETVREAWSAASIEDRRGVARALIDSATVAPGARGVRFSGPERVAIDWNV